jgi:hypothetical protein
MTFPKLLLALFHDTYQGSSPENQSRTNSFKCRGGSTWQDDVEDVNNKHNKNLYWLYNQSLELDMDLVEEEANKEGDGDSNCSAAKADKLFYSVLLRVS